MLHPRPVQLKHHFIGRNTYIADVPTNNCRTVSVLSCYLNEGPVVWYDFVKLWWPEPLLRGHIF